MILASCKHLGVFANPWIIHMLSLGAFDHWIHGSLAANLRPSWPTPGGHQSPSTRRNGRRFPNRVHKQSPDESRPIPFARKAILFLTACIRFRLRTL
ncbi:hypothetical protein K440DRAFT_423696 [Wilcoxina mikolae CBS 423.85]|nr:hypothetical protein K440DRAFT_423696 [Wilcoxina mikolae CBS 423.85]